LPPAAPSLPSLIAVAPSGELARLAPAATAFAREPWVLGVMAFELERAGRRVAGRLRAALPGMAPASFALTPGEAVHVFLHRQGAAPELPDPPVPYVGGGALGGAALFVDGKPASVVLLEGKAAFDHPPPRALGRVYCRWLRGGDVELGCDLTDFASGGAAPKLVSRFVEPRSVLTFALLGG
jgi:hypothetical protein